MEIQTQEARIILAIEAIRTSKKLSKRSVAKIYKVPKAILRHRIAGRTYRPKIKANYYRLNDLEEDTII
jgi:DNA-binding transcriptional regulator YiaG